MRKTKRNRLVVERAADTEEGPNSIVMGLSEMNRWTGLLQAYVNDVERKGLFRTKTRRMTFRRDDCVKVLRLRSAWWRFWTDRKIDLSYITYTIDEYDNPPSLAEKIRALACGPTLRHSQLGCMAEIFRQDTDKFGRNYAIYLYCWDTTRDIGHLLVKTIPLAVLGYLGRLFTEWRGH